MHEIVMPAAWYIELKITVLIKRLLLLYPLEMHGDTLKSEGFGDYFLSNWV